MNATATAGPRRRADASRNRERILDAAREAILEDGPDVPLDTIAQRAGVGNATVYRHFTDRKALLRELMLYSMTRITDAAEAALADRSDAFEVLRGFVHTAADERVGALCGMLSEDFDARQSDVIAARDRLTHAVQALMDRARESGQLRPDVAIGDLMVAVTQLGRPLPGSECAHFKRYARRHLQVFVDGLRNPARSTLPGDPITMEELERRTT
nr:TetR/AcrR family transcriptional regulator [Phytoactinopolyspora limicola]